MEYALITVAWNEDEFIEKTILSVVGQNILPKIWVIVNDGSTDRTEEIINKYAVAYSWIDIISIEPHSSHSFASKVRGFLAAYERIRSIDFDIIGNVDADISFEPNYFEFLLDKFESDPRLGVAGTPFVEDGRHYDYRFTSIEHVSGACQLFRRECYEEIGGYKPIKEGELIGWQLQPQG